MAAILGPDDIIGNLRKIRIITKKGSVLDVEDIDTAELYFDHEKGMSDEK